MAGSGCLFRWLGATALLQQFCQKLDLGIVVIASKLFGAVGIARDHCLDQRLVLGDQFLIVVGQKARLHHVEADLLDDEAVLFGQALMPGELNDRRMQVEIDARRVLEAAFADGVQQIVGDLAQTRAVELR